MTDISLEISTNNYMNDYNHVCSLKDETNNNETNTKLNMVTNNDSKISNPSVKKSPTFSCTNCNYHCSKQSEWNKHLATAKHKRFTQDQNKVSQVSFVCKCGKSYKYRQGLHLHKKKCTAGIKENVQDAENLQSLKTAFVQVMNEFSKALQNQNDENKKRDELLEQMLQKLGSTTINANNSNNNFNINMFLNNECKDALNFSDFINNIQVSREDLQNNARLGFVEGISKIFIDNLSQLTIYERPIHCTDTKRETVYIKDDNCWSKENEKVKQLLNNSIQAISRKSVNSLTQWKSENDDYNDVNSDFSELCLHIHKHSIAGYDRDKFYPKVMKKITGHVHLTKRQGLPSLGRTLLSD